MSFMANESLTEGLHKSWNRLYSDNKITQDEAKTRTTNL